MKCLLFRNEGSSRMGRRMGCCDIDVESTSCEGDVTFCEKTRLPEAIFPNKIRGF
jgi:hypothetical protein